MKITIEGLEGGAPTTATITGAAGTSVPAPTTTTAPEPINAGPPRMLAVAPGADITSASAADLSDAGGPPEYLVALLGEHPNRDQLTSSASGELSNGGAAPNIN